MSLQWSPADLDRQRQIVGLAVDRAQSNRERLWSARHALAGRLRTAAVPVAVSAAALAAAFALGRYVAPRAAARRYREPVSAPAEQAGSRSTSNQVTAARIGVTVCSRMLCGACAPESTTWNGLAGFASSVW